MSSFQTQIISLACNTSSKDAVLDLSTSAEPEAWWARDLTIRASVFADAGLTLLDVSDLSSATLYLKDPSNLDGSPLFSQALDSFDNTTTLGTWNGGTKQQLLFTLPADSLSFGGLTNGQRLLHLSIVAVTTGGKTGTLCVGTMNLIDDGGNSPGSNPVNAITVAQADALIGALGWAGAVVALSAAGTTNVLQTGAWLTGRLPVTLAAGGAGAYAANLCLSDSNALAGAVLRVIIDFAATLNPTLNIYDGTTGGTLLQSIGNIDATARSYYFQAGFDGAAWHKENGMWIP